MNIGYISSASFVKSADMMNATEVVSTGLLYNANSSTYTIGSTQNIIQVVPQGTVTLKHYNASIKVECN